MMPLRASALGLALAGCGPGEPDVCAQSSSLFHAAKRSTLLGLTREQENAIGYVADTRSDPLLFCTGVLISSGWVLTARHCWTDEPTRFGIGQDERDPLATFAVERAFTHDQLDLALLQLEPAASELATARSIPITAEQVDERWLGTALEIAGFGRTEAGSRGRRLFVGEPVVAIDESRIAVDGAGRSGACTGDSGGPVLGRDGDGSLRVMGVLSVGSESCTGIDVYVRVDAARAWIEEHVGATIEGSIECDGPAIGQTCQHGLAMRCEDAAIVVEPCLRDAPCVWDDGGQSRCALAEPSACER